MEFFRGTCPEPAEREPKKDPLDHDRTFDLCIPALSAQELKFGAQATLSLPTGDVGDFVDKELGYQFTRHLGAELRFTDAKYEPEFYGHKGDIKAPTANASFVYRF